MSLMLSLPLVGHNNKRPESNYRLCPGVLTTLLGVDEHVTALRSELSIAGNYSVFRKWDIYMLHHWDLSPIFLALRLWLHLHTKYATPAKQAHWWTRGGVFIYTS